MLISSGKDSKNSKKKFFKSYRNSLKGAFLAHFLHNYFSLSGTVRTWPLTFFGAASSVCDDPLGLLLFHLVIYNTLICRSGPDDLKN